MTGQESEHLARRQGRVAFVRPLASRLQAAELGAASRQDVRDLSSGQPMAFRNKVRPGEWVPGSARVEANLESDHPTWVLTVAQGPRNRRLDIAAGPISTRRLGDRIGQLLNNMDVAEWDRFINRALHEVLDGAWG